MISTPLDKYEADVYELAEGLSRETGLIYSKKKNRVIFPKQESLLKRLGVEDWKGRRGGGVESQLSSQNW